MEASRSEHGGHCTIFSDGGARGNPGPAAAGAVIVADDGEVVAEINAYLGIATNNVAEYRALALALKRALDLGFRRVDVRLDSELLVKQLTGQYRVKDLKMVALHSKVAALLAQFESTGIAWVRRSENKRADKLVNAVLDARAAAGKNKREVVP